MENKERDTVIKGHKAPTVTLMQGVWVKISFQKGAQQIRVRSQT